MIGMILAAGAGTRLLPLTSERPKALFPVLDVPVLERQLHAMALAGVGVCFVNAHHLSDQIRQALPRMGEAAGVDTRLVVEEPHPLGTAGALANIPGLKRDRVLLANADVVTDLPMSQLVEHHGRLGTAATLVAVRDAQRSDLVVEEGLVAGLVDRRKTVVPGLVYGGVAVLEPEALTDIPSGPSGLFETVMRPCLSSSRGMAALVWDGYWNDIGTPRTYLSCNLDALRARLGSFDGRPGWVGTSFIAPGAQVDAPVSESVIGEGASVREGGSLARCVVWPGAVVDDGEEHADEIIGLRSRVRTTGA